MTTIIAPGTPIVFMKVGTHAKESLADILRRKRKEIDEAGFALWGYGGSTCHPQTMVQPFARSYAREGKAIYLCMEEMVSKHDADPVRADQSSSDGLTWQDIPAAVNVLGSRYALVIDGLRNESFELPLARTHVALGNSQGLSGERYIKGRVDKACLEVGAASEVEGGRRLPITLVAELAAPYAVFLRNRP